MPDQPYLPDYLHTFGRLHRRVSNLETGVHPVTADVDYFDSTDWASVDVITGLGFINAGWRWRKRIGIVMMDGGPKETGTGTGAFAAIGPSGLKIATLPGPARPSVDLYVRVIILEGDQFQTLAQIQTDGDVILFNQGGGDSPGPFLFDGVTYTPHLMAYDFRRPDSLTRHATVTERVRKLEVMSQTLTVRPGEWQAREELDDIATQLVLCQAPVSQPLFNSGTGPHQTWMVDRAAQQGMEELYRDGYITEARASEWTGLLRGCGAVWGSGSSPNTVRNFEEATTAEVVEPIPPAVMSNTVDYTRSGGKLHVWSGALGPGAHHWIDEGHLFGSIHDPDHLEMPAGEPVTISVSWDGTVTPFTIFNNGGWVIAHSGEIPYEWAMSGDDAQYIISSTPDVIVDCEADDFPHQIGDAGRHAELLGPYTHPWACPADPGEHPLIGGTLFGVPWNPDQAMWLATPPMPYRGETTSFTTGSSVPTNYYQLRHRVAVMLDYFPNVKDWIMGVQSRFAVNTPDRHRWHTLLRSPTHRGRVEARVQDRHVLLRGHIRVYGTGNDMLAMIDTRFVPPPAKTPFYFTVPTTDGRTARVVLDNSDLPSDYPHDYPITLHSLEPPAREETSAIDLVFDGLAYPTDIPLY